MQTNRALGYVLLSAGVIGVLLSFTFTHNYAPGPGVIWNLANRSTFRVTRTVDCRVPDAPRPPCPAVTLRVTTVEQEVFSAPLGVAVAAFLAVSLAGTGILILGARKP